MNYLLKVYDESVYVFSLRKLRKLKKSDNIFRCA